MKTINYIQMIVLSLCMGSATIWGQSKIVQKRTDNINHVSFVEFAKDTVIPLKKAPDLLKNIQSQVKEADTWKVSKKRNEIKDENGYQHQFYQQYYKGIKVENGEFSVHAVNDNIESVLGNFEAVGDVSVTPNLSENEALKYALKYIDAEIYKWEIPEEEKLMKKYFNESYYPVGELVIVKDRLKTDKMYRLAYKFDIYAHKPMSRNYIWIDAINGEVINIESRIHFSNSTGTAATRYSGTRTITTDSYNGAYRLRETRNGVNISTFNMNHTGNYTSTDFTDNNNNWTAAEFHNANKDDAALDAHWGAEMVYEYFKQVHNRNSWNGNNGALLSYINGNLPLINNEFSNSDNAFWDGNKITYGQGTFYPPLTTLDICAHEIGHGVCQSTVDLGVSATEKGAINESLSDIWAACVENWATTDKQTWLIGEELGTPIRSMSNPNQYSNPDTYQGDNWYTGSNIDIYVHRNSGVGNFWFYLLSQGGTGTNDLNNAYNVTGIGINKAAKIVYKAETSYLTSSANYAQFRNATISAATNIYGSNSLEVASVTNAWYAVGVGSQYPIAMFGNNNPYIFQQVTYNVPIPSNTTVTWSGSSNVNIISGQGTSQVTISICSGSTATLTATLSGTVNQVLNKNINVNAGYFSLIEYLDHVDVWLNNPYAECFDWEISNSFYSSVIGSGNIYCSSHNNELLFPSGEDAYGSVSVRAKNGNCVSSWQGSSFSLWRPTLLGNFNPLRPEPLYVCVEDIPVSMINGAEFYWYFDGSLIAVTSEPSVYYWDWPCGDHVFSLVVNIGGKESLPSSTDFWGMCGGSGGWGVSSAAYPNPAGNELIIDREEKSDEIKANAAVGGQSAKASNATVKVLLYSHSTAKLVYSNDFSASAEQIRIDTSKLPNGVYYLNMIANNEKIKEQTIIVNH